VLYLRAPDGRIFNLPAGSSLAGAADSTTPRASGATAETIIEPSDDPDYTAALAAYFTERWDTAVELFTRVLAKYPEHRQAAERLAEAQRHQQLAQWDTDAREAAEQGRWEVAVAALERLHAAKPDRSDVQQQLEHARTQEKIAALQADLRRMHHARQWQAVIAVGEQLAEIDPQLTDQNGLVSAAKTELAEKALADRYRAGLLQLDRGDRVAAAETFAAIETERPGYRDAAALLARARERSAEPEQQAATAQRAPAPPRPALPPETPSPSRAEPTGSRVQASTPTRTPQSERPPASPQPTPDAPSLPAAPAQAGPVPPRDTGEPTSPDPGHTATPSVTGRGKRLGIRHVLWALIPVLSLGTLVPVPFAHAAARLHDRRLWLITTAYVIAWVLVLRMTIATESGYLYVSLMFVATAHAWWLRQRVFAEPSASLPTTEP
jgi:hypothetical protein